MAESSRPGLFWRIVSFLAPIFIERLIIGRMPDAASTADTEELKTDLHYVQKDAKDLTRRVEELIAEQQKLRVKITELDAALATFKLLIATALPVLFLLSIVLLVVVLMHH